MSLLSIEKSLRRQIKTSLNKMGFLSSVAILTSGTVVGQMILLLASPILTRLYTPGDFGLFALVLAFLGFAAIFVTLSYDSAIVAAQADEDAARLTFLAMGLSAITALVPLVVLSALIHFDAGGFGSLPGWVVFVLLPGLVITALFAALRAWLLRINGFAVISKISVTQNILRAFAQIFFGLWGVGWIGLVFGDLMGRGGGVAAMAQQAQIIWRTRLHHLRFADFWDTARRYRRFPLYVLPSSLIDTLTLILPLPAITYLYGPTVAGYYALVQRVIAAPLSMVGMSVADAFYNRVSIYVREEPTKVKPFFLRTAAVLGGLGALPALLLMGFGPLLFGWIFGDEWVMAGAFASVMSLWALAQFIVSPLTRIVFVLGAQRLKLIYDLLSFTLVVCAFYVGYSFQLSAITTIALLSIFNVVAYLVYFLVLFTAIRHAISPAHQ